MQEKFEVNILNRDGETLRSTDHTELFLRGLGLKERNLLEKLGSVFIFSLSVPSGDYIPDHF